MYYSLMNPLNVGHLGCFFFLLLKTMHAIQDKSLHKAMNISRRRVLRNGISGYDVLKSLIILSLHPGTPSPLGYLSHSKTSLPLGSLQSPPQAQSGASWWKAQRCGLCHLPFRDAMSCSGTKGSSLHIRTVDSVKPSK